MSLMSPIKDKDWVSVRQANARLSSLKLGPTSFPTFAGMTLTGGLTLPFLTDDSLIYPTSSGVLTSLGVAANGQLVIGSTGTTPVLSTLTGTANQITSTPGAGSITLSTPQDIHTAASNFTVAGETITDLTTSRLMYSNGAKVLSSVSDLTAWIAGTTDHISVTDDSDGTVTLDLDTNTQTLLGSFNGIFLETIDFTVAEAGGTVTGSLEQDSTGDLIQKFSDGYTTLDCTPALTIDLTAYVGTNAVPKEVFVYILQSAKTVIAASNTDWPATEHIKIANLLLKSATTTGTDGGALVNRNWNDHAQSADGQGHITHIENRLRQEPTQWDSGVALTLKNSAGAVLTTTNSSTAVEIVTTVGAAYQLHKQTFPAFDMYVTATDDAHIVNQPTDEGGAYETTVDLVTDVTHYVDGSASGVAIGVNKYFNLVIWGVQNRTGTPSHIMINLPTSQYTTSGNAIADVDGTSVYEIPSAFKGKGFLIARLTFRKIGGGQWTYIAQEDLRGKFPDIIAGVGITTTDHALLANLTAPADDHTQYLLVDGSRALTGNLSLGFGDLVSEQNPDAVNAIRLKGTASDVDVVLGDVTGYFSVWNAADNNAVFYVSNVGNTDIAGDLTVANAAVIGSNSVVFQPGTDSTTFFQILDQNGGTPILSVDAILERVGIGTDAPEKSLHLKATGVSCAFMLETKGGAVDRRWQWFVSSGTGNFFIRDEDAGVNCISFERGAPVNSFYIATSTGYVGMGTNNPGFDLDVQSGAATATIEAKNTRSAGNRWATLRLVGQADDDYDLEITTAGHLGTLAFNWRGSDIINVDANGLVNVGELSANGFYPRRITQATIPAAGTGATQIDTAEFMVWRDSDDGVVYLVYNDTTSGIKSIALG